jgi:hypothetical protein
MKRRRLGRRGLVAFVTAGSLTIALLSSGCFLAQRGPDRPAATAVAGTAIYRERCDVCHPAEVGGFHAGGPHAARGIRCGQCHRPAGHPEFLRPVQDGTCGGCHQSQLQQVVASKHSATRIRIPLDGDRAARVSLRRDGFVARTASGAYFVGDVAAGELGGRLCAACHYDGHRLGAASVQRKRSCTGCHADRDRHYPGGIGAATNRCVHCHMSGGETRTGQRVISHRFGSAGVGAADR